MYVVAGSAILVIVSYSLIIDNGTGAQAGWNWMLSLSVSETTSH
jgi:hypothetical protein